MFANPCSRQCQQTQCIVSPTHRDAIANAQPMPSHSDFQSIASPMPSHMHEMAKPMQLPYRSIRESQATSALEPTCHTRAACANQGPPNNCCGDKHCRFTLLPNALSTTIVCYHPEKLLMLVQLVRRLCKRLVLVAEPIRTLHWTSIHQSYQ